MTKKEFAVFAMALKTYFPRDNLLPTEEAMELWYRELQDIPSDVATAMLRKWVDMQNWPPTIAEIRKMCAEIACGKLPEWSDGWMEVTKAINRYGYMQYDRAMDSLSPITRSAVKMIGWQDLCMSENPDIIRAQFRQVYEIAAKREGEERQLSPALKGDIATLGRTMSFQLEEQTEKGCD